VTIIPTTRFLIVPAIGLLIIRAQISGHSSPTQGTSDLLPPGDRLTALPITAVTIRDAFWAPRLDVNRTRTLDHVPQEIEGTGGLRNFDIAVGKATGTFGGPFCSISASVARLSAIARFPLAGAVTAFIYFAAPAKHRFVARRSRRDRPFQIHRGSRGE
jgi:hypothetical protein